MRFNLIDRIIEQTPDRVVAVKTVSNAEEYLGDHFPGFPVLPGVMMLETLVQAGRILLRDPSHAGIHADRLVVAEVKNLRYGNMVRPGDHLTVEVTIRSGDLESGFELQGKGTRDDLSAVQGRFRLVTIPQDDETR